MKAGGVTLIELLMAIVILSLVLGMSGVALASLRLARGPEAQRRIEQARVLAIRSGHVVTISLTPDTGHVLLLPDGRIVGPGFDPLTGARDARR